MIDYMHPMVLLNSQILNDINEKGQLERDIEVNTLNLQKMFVQTFLYRELKEKYIIVELQHIDEEITEIKVVFRDSETRGLDTKILELNTQEIDDKLEQIKEEE